MAPKKIPGLIAQDTLNMILSNTTEAKQSIKEIQVHLGNLHVVSNEHKLILDEHMRRTELNEKTLAAYESKANSDRESLASRVVPLEHHTAMWAGAAKVLVVAGLISAVAASVYKLITIFN
jgi:hypothetical protein